MIGTDMKKHRIVMLYLIGCILVFATPIIWSVVYAHASGLKADNTIRITAYNPYRLSVRLEVKCDHDWKTNRFLFHKFIDVPGKQDTVIQVPNNMRDCQIWPKITF